jgi:aryl-alcohol dehydrogenase-like predicted oxidoreductase
MASHPAHDAGTFQLGGATPIYRMGYGAMRITGEGIWGPPKDHDAALAVLRRALDLGITFIDTADSYGPNVSEDLIAEALHPYADDLVIATKAGLTRTGPGEWHPVGRPEYLRQCCELSLRRLKLDAIPLYQLHRIDPQVPREEQFGVLKDLQEEGKVIHLGLSEVGVEEIQAAQEHFDVATVQNRYSLGHREHEDVVDYCDAQGIGFIPWYPLDAGKLSDSDVLAETADALDATHAQVALAWLLKRSPVMLPIPGTSSVEHLEENTRAATLALSDEQFDKLDASTKESV